MPVALPWRSQTPKGGSYLCEIDWKLARAVPSFPLGLMKGSSALKIPSISPLVLAVYSVASYNPHLVTYIFSSKECPERKNYAFPSYKTNFPFSYGKLLAELSECSWTIHLNPGMEVAAYPLPYWVTSLGAQVSALCSLHVENASLKRRGHRGLMFEECRAGINACGN